ncbi:hypothetical protein FRC01_013766, partial [Tulasnella sp. 417]
MTVLTHRPQFLHAPGCSCDVCSAPALWKTVLASSVTRPEPAATAESEQTQQVERNSFRIPSWIFPSTSAERKGMGDVEKGVRGTGSENKLDLEAILDGRTRSPVSMEDLKAFLRVERDNRLGELAALDFLVAFNRYKASFFALHPSQQAPDPYTVIEQLSTVGIDARPPVPPKDPGYSPVVFVSPQGRPSDEQVKSTFPALPGRAVLPESTSGLPSNPKPVEGHGRKRSVPSDGDGLPLLVLDPTVQPLRSELQVIVDSYLSGFASTLLMSIVPSDVISLALSETELTTHPSALLPVANTLMAHFNNKVLPFFFRDAVVNLSRTTSHGRLLMAILIFVIAMGLSAMFIVLKSVFPRWSRLALTPLYLASIGYAIGSQTGLCFWLAWRGTREAKQYEEDEKALAAERQLRRHSTASGSAESTL